MDTPILAQAYVERYQVKRALRQGDPLFQDDHAILYVPDDFHGYIVGLDAAEVNFNEVQRTPQTYRCGGNGLPVGATRPKQRR